MWWLASWIILVFLVILNATQIGLTSFIVAKIRILDEDDGDDDQTEVLNSSNLVSYLSLSPGQIIYMGWVDEKEQDSVQDRMYSPKFLALRGSSLFKFSAPPVSRRPSHLPSVVWATLIFL